MKVVWSDDAVADLERIHAYWEGSSPKYAAHIANRLLKLVAHLEFPPELGVRFGEPHSRKLFVGGTPFIVFSDVESERIELTAVIDARDNP